MKTFNVELTRTECFTISAEDEDTAYLSVLDSLGSDEERATAGINITLEEDEEDENN
jgi:hypothetical protein